MYQCWQCGVIGLNLSNLPQFPKCTKTGITWPADGLYPWVRLHLMWNVEFNFLDNFYVLLSMTWDVWAQFVQLTLIPQIHKTNKIDPQMAFTLKLGFIWCEMWILTLWMTFHVLVPMIGEIWAQSPQFASIPQIYWNRYNLTRSKASFDVKCSI